MNPPDDFVSASLPHPVGVAPLDVEIGTSHGHRMVLLALERWTDWADLRFARIDVAGTHRLARRVPPAEAWRVTADGHELEIIEVVGRGDRSFSNGEVRLRPCPAAGARLAVSVMVVPGSQPIEVTIPVPEG